MSLCAGTVLRADTGGEGAVSKDMTLSQTEADSNSTHFYHPGVYSGSLYFASLVGHEMMWLVQR